MMVGFSSVYTKPFSRTAVPSSVVTSTSTAPGVGDDAVLSLKEFELRTVMSPCSISPKNTVVPLSLKFLPLTIT